MKQKNWKDCPSCGLDDSMVLKENQSKRFSLKTYPSINIKELDVYVCKDCKEGIYSIKSQNIIQSILAEHKAREDSKVTVLSDVMNVKQASEKLDMTETGVRKLMRTGKLEYVFLGDKRVPKKEAVRTYQKAS